ncbi:MAG: hypothetical protein WCQ69_00365 [Bacteroidales bacterium]|jgi:hypothetical protein|nr:hypothetical protein [Bacteroidales bacterium]MDD2264702.1 hypothetical protein [Bacteroidales bacterium]MDD2832176.1 hypothetical protein [Bacteroidales bacterium]MDD3209071.1 hypothetical protein [Bacteroidales bacterium]MDD3697921.1 hypothetical protein [Bacteroidales bacterium]
MVWIKLGILIIGFIYAGLIPFTVRRVVRQIDFDLHQQTLSFLSNKTLYDKRYVRGYTRLLFATAVLHYVFFGLLSKYYNLGEHETYMQYITYSFAFLTLLAFVPHNIRPYSLKRLSTTLQRLAHNMLAIVVFFSLPTLIILFQTAVIETMPFLGIAGLILIGGTLILTAMYIIRQGVNGISEIFFINGISFWTVFVTIYTVLFG